MNRQKIAIIGSGIAGSSAAYFLREHDVTIYEKESYTGGHTNTITVNKDDREVKFDTGFMVFNHITYPYLTRLFKELEVSTYPTSMSFSVQHKQKNIEYCGSGFKGLFGQRRNLLRPGFWNLLRHINRFNAESLRLLSAPNNESITVKEFCKDLRLSENFLYTYLVPMSSAVWSTPPGQMLDFPAVSLVRFFHNHGFLGMNTQHQWYTVKDGSSSYMKSLHRSAGANILLNTPVSRIYRENGKVTVESKNGRSEYDKVIVASHADQSARMVTDLNAEEKALLGSFTYQKNSCIIHTDDKVMPARRNVWSSWNYRVNGSAGDFRNTTIYWMNNLQQIASGKNYFVSIDDPGLISGRHIIKELEYEHPVFSTRSLKAQSSLHLLNRDGLYFCGSYFRYGFHEDALMSSVEVASSILKRDLWKS